AEDVRPGRAASGGLLQGVPDRDGCGRTLSRSRDLPRSGQQVLAHHQRRQPAHERLPRRRRQDDPRQLHRDHVRLRRPRRGRGGPPVKRHWGWWTAAAALIAVLGWTAPARAEDKATAEAQKAQADAAKAQAEAQQKEGQQTVDTILRQQEDLLSGRQFSY